MAALRTAVQLGVNKPARLKERTWLADPVSVSVLACPLAHPIGPGQTVCPICGKRLLALESAVAAAVPGGPNAAPLTSGVEVPTVPPDLKLSAEVPTQPFSAPVGSRFCPDCGQPSHSRFCAHCGARQDVPPADTASRRVEEPAAPQAPSRHFSLAGLEAGWQRRFEQRVGDTSKTGDLPLLGNGSTSGVMPAFADLDSLREKVNWAENAVPISIAGGLAAVVLLLIGFSAIAGSDVDTTVVDMARVSAECDEQDDKMEGVCITTLAVSDGYAVVFANNSSDPVYIASEDIVGIDSSGSTYEPDQYGECDINPNELCDLIVSFSGADDIKRIEVYTETGTIKVSSGDFAGKKEMEALFGEGSSSSSPESAKVEKQLKEAINNAGVIIVDEVDCGPVEDPDDSVVECEAVQATGEVEQVLVTLAGNDFEYEIQ